MSEPGIERPEGRCLFYAEEETGIESEVVRDYDDMRIVACEATREVVVETRTSTAKLCREHAEHCVETGKWEFADQQQKLPMTDGGTEESGKERSEDEELGSWADAHDAYVEEKLRRAVDPLEADCELCGNAVEPATEREMHICRTCLREDVQVADRVATDGGTDSPGTDQDEAAEYVANARAMLAQFEDESAEVRRGSIKHAIAELENARRCVD